VKTKQNQEGMQSTSFLNTILLQENNDFLSLEKVLPQDA
jgi:hypothetical protein